MKNTYQLRYKGIQDKDWTSGLVVKLNSLQEAKKMARETYGDPCDAVLLEGKESAPVAAKAHPMPAPRPALPAIEPMKARKRVYLAGALNAPACGYLKNVGIMMKWAEELRLQGFAVLNPAQDLLSGICSQQGMTYEDYFENNAAWILGSEAIFLCPGWKESKGCQEEVRIAATLNIPRFENIGDLVRWRTTCQK